MQDIKIKEISIKCEAKEYIDIDKLIPFQGKLKAITKENFEKLKRSLIKDGLPLGFHIWKEKDKNYIMDGHHRQLALKAVREDGYFVPPVPCNNVIAKNKKEAAKAVLVSNSKYASMSESSISDYMIEHELSVDDLMELDIPELNMDDFNIDLNDKTFNSDPDEVPEVVEPIAKLGQIYKLGQHRLMCGDSTDEATVSALMNGEKADMVFTDPPYGISVVSKDGSVGGGTKGKYKQVMNDENTNVAELSFQLCQKMDTNLIFWGANHYSNVFPSSSCWIVWDKQDGKRVTFADCELAYTNIKKPARLFKHIWDGFRRDSEKGDMRVHPTQKPVKLIQDIFDLFKDESGKLILDLFGGSGSTLIACEKTNRKCFMMELDPHYVDVIIARWEKFTGKKAELLNG